MIRRLRAEMAFDIRGMGGTFYLPLWISVIFVAITIPVVMVSKMNGYENSRTLPLMEMYIPMMGAIWGIFSLQDMLEEPGGNIYFSYRRRRSYWGVVRQLRFYALYVILTAAVCGVTGWMMEQNFFPWQWVLYLGQGFFLMGLGFCAMTFTGKSGYAMIVVAAYVCTHRLFDLGTMTAHTTVYLGNESMVVMAVEECLTLLIRSVCLGLVGLIAGQIRLQYR